MRIVTGHKILAAIIGALVLLALCAGTAMAVTTATNSHNAAVIATAQAKARAHSLVIRRQVEHRTEVRAIAAANRKAEKAQRDARQARREARRAANPPAAVVAAPPEGQVQPGNSSNSSGLAPTGIGTNGEQVYSNSITSTAFAMNVESDYWSTPGMEFTSYSPVTGQTYYMTATDNGGTVTVTNGEGCVIQFSD